MTEVNVGYTLACGAGGSGFESRPSPNCKLLSVVVLGRLGGVAARQVVTLVPSGVVSPNLSPAHHSVVTGGSAAAGLHKPGQSGSTPGFATNKHLSLDWKGGSAMKDLTLCFGLTDLFFSDELADIEIAKSFCAECPLRARCLEGAIQRREPCGVWGGQWIREGKPVVPGRRGRPPRTEQAA